MSENTTPSVDDMIQAAQEEVKEISDKSVEETASFMFALHYPQFSSIVDTLSNKSLRRIIKAMVAVPLEDATVNLKLAKEKMAYMLCEKLMISKFGLVISTLWKHEQEIQKYKTESKKQGEENNG